MLGQQCRYKKVRSVCPQGDCVVSDIFARRLFHCLSASAQLTMSGSRAWLGELLRAEQALHLYQKRAPACARKPTRVFLRRTTLPASGSSRPAPARNTLLGRASSRSTLHGRGAQTKSCACKQAVRGRLCDTGALVKSSRPPRRHASQVQQHRASARRRIGSRLE